MLRSLGKGVVKETLEGGEGNGVAIVKVEGKLRSRVGWGGGNGVFHVNKF